MSRFLSLDGGESWEVMPNSYVYDPRTGTWTELAAMPNGTERGSAAVGVDGTRILLAGGMRTLTPSPGGLQDTVDTVTSHDTATGETETLPSLAQGRDHVGGAVVGGTFYVLGGRDRGQANDPVHRLRGPPRQIRRARPLRRQLPHRPHDGRSGSTL